MIEYPAGTGANRVIGSEQLAVRAEAWGTAACRPATRFQLARQSLRLPFQNRADGAGNRASRGIVVAFRIRAPLRLGHQLRPKNLQPVSDLPLLSTSTNCQRDFWQLQRKCAYFLCRVDTEETKRLRRNGMIPVFIAFDEAVHIHQRHGVFHVILGNDLVWYR